MPEVLPTVATAVLLLTQALVVPTLVSEKVAVEPVITSGLPKIGVTTGEGLTDKVA